MTTGCCDSPWLKPEGCLVDPEGVRTQAGNPRCWGGHRMASREVVPRTWPQGLNAAERIKAEMERAALDNPENPEEEEVFDDLLWRQNVTDLHRVMEVAKSLWLLLEHSNEAMVRVALEIALDGTYKKVLWWPDFWFSDHEKREYFKEIVRIKLAIAIANAKGSAVDFSEFEKNDEESELVAKLRKQIAELEAALRDARLEKEAAEARIRELELAAKEAEEKLAAMEKSLEQLRREVKEFRRQSDNAGPSASLEELERVKQQLKQSEEKNAQLEEMISQLRKQLQEGNKSGDVEKIKSELQMAKKRIEELEQKLMDAQKEIAILKRQKGGAPGPPVPVATDDSEAIRRLKEELEEERRRRQELEDLLKKTEAEMDQLKKDIDAERKKSLDLSNQLKNLPKSDNKKETITEIKEVTVPGGLSEEQLRELEELRAKAEELEKLKAKLKKRDQQIASLQEDNDKLNEEQVRLLKLLKQVREQLRILMELAEKKGLGDVIKKLFEEAGLGKTMADPDYTCFDRLYDDALRRMDKQRRMEWYRLGNTGEPPPSFKARQPVRARCKILIPISLCLRGVHTSKDPGSTAWRPMSCHGTPEVSAEIQQTAAVAPYLHPSLIRRVCPDESRGQGVFTTRPLSSGELLLASPPLAAVQGVQEDALADSLADVILERLADETFAAKFWSLSSGSVGGESMPRKRPRCDVRQQVLRIIAVNAHGWPKDEQRGLGLWQWQAYMNHADPMDANCSSVFIGEVLLMRALRDIDENQEVVNSYCPPSSSLTLRKVILRHTGVPLRPDMELTDETKSLQAAVRRSSSMMEAAMVAMHGSDPAEGEQILAEVLAMGCEPSVQRRNLI
eukprot:s1251_g31.t1